MKKLLFFLFAGAQLLFPACTDNRPQVKGMELRDNTYAPSELVEATKEERNRQTILKLYESLNQHDVRMFFQEWDPGAIDYGHGPMHPVDNWLPGAMHHGVNPVGMMRNLDVIQSFYGKWFNAFPDIKADIRRIVADGEWVLVWGDWSGTWQRPFLEQKATGKPFRVRDVDIYRFNEDGKIVEHYHIQPFESIARQVGLKVELP